MRRVKKADGSSTVIGADGKIVSNEPAPTSPTVRPVTPAAAAASTHAPVADAARHATEAVRRNAIEEMVTATRTERTDMLTGLRIESGGEPYAYRANNYIADINVHDDSNGLTYIVTYENADRCWRVGWTARVERSGQNDQEGELEPAYQTPVAALYAAAQHRADVLGWGEAEEQEECPYCGRPSSEWDATSDTTCGDKACRSQAALEEAADGYM